MPYPNDSATINVAVEVRISGLEGPTIIVQEDQPYTSLKFSHDAADRLACVALKRVRAAVEAAL